MKYKFNTKRKWFKVGINSVVYVLAVLLTGIFMFITLDAGATANMILVIAYTIFSLLGIYRAIYYFNLHKKDYLIIEESSLSIYRGNFLSRKIIRFNQVEHVVRLNEMIILKLNNGKEEQIYTEWLSDKNALELKKKLKQMFGPKAIAF